MRLIELGQTAGRASAVTIGKFDGVHLGHRALLERTRTLAGETGSEAGVVTFDRHPLEILKPGSAPLCLTPLPDRLRLLEQAGMDFCLLLRLDSGLLNWPDERFVEDVIVRTVRATHVITGEDFRYGHNRTGNPTTLAEAGRTHGFEVHGVPPVLTGGTRVSSYAIRNALRAGNLPLAESMLGRPYSVCGNVESGRKLGRTLGYPTANVRYDANVVIPANGIYVVTADWGEGERRGVASIGVRPTVEGGPAPVWLEVFVLDWEGDLYGRNLSVAFVKRLRDEIRFPTLDALKEQIALDVLAARNVFGH